MGQACESCPLLVIVGPTAVGKTELSLEVAERLNGEIVSADSMQVYRGMDIGTAKPTPEQRSRVTHHLVDIVEPEEDYSVALFQQDARRAVSDIAQRGRLPMLAGGTGFYVHAVVDTTPLPAVPPDVGLRQSLREEADRFGAAMLHQRLQQVDAGAAGRIHPNDIKRVIRALEVFRATGQALSSFLSPGASNTQGHSNCLDQSPSTGYNAVILGLTRSRDSLYQRIERRVDRMLIEGFLDEVQHLNRRGCHRGLVAMQGLGYRHALSHFAGEMDLTSMVETWKRDTRRFAKRQLTWFRRDVRIEWLDLDVTAWRVAVESVVGIATRLFSPGSIDSRPTFSSPNRRAVIPEN